MIPFTSTGTDRMKLPRLYPPVLFLLFSLIAMSLDQLVAARVNLGPTAHAVAYIIAAMGGLLALWARAMFLYARTSVNPFADASLLLTHGVYRISRNPMYLGLLLALIALVIWLQNLSGAVLPPLFVLLINRCHIQPEEQRLTAQFGESYRKYLTHTRRWI